MSANHSLSVEQTNKRLPLVRLIAQDAIQCSRTILRTEEEVGELEESLRPLASATETLVEANSDDVAVIQLLQQLHERIDSQRQKLSECRRELQEIGANLVDASTGLVEFPSELDGKPVSLSWRYDEPKVTHWRGRDEDIRTRHPLQPAHPISG